METLEPLSVRPSSESSIRESAPDGFDLNVSASPNASLPMHAHVNYAGNGWECDRGFRRVGEYCVPVEIPANASLNYVGNDWECDPGYTRMGDLCVR